MNKREGCRAIIIFQNSLMVMYREKADKVYYTFPGGGREENESKEECIIRECLEEFGIRVKPLTIIYEYEDAKSVQHFFVCEWIDGEFGSGEGEEYEAGNNKGIYVPTFMPLDLITTLPLMPPEIAKALSEDLKNNKELTNVYRKIYI